MNYGQEECLGIASFPGLLTPAFVAYSTNAGDGLVKPFSCSVVHGHWVDDSRLNHKVVCCI